MTPLYFCSFWHVTYLLNDTVNITYKLQVLYTYKWTIPDSFRVLYKARANQPMNIWINKWVKSTLKVAHNRSRDWLTSHGAGQQRPVNSGKLFVCSSVTRASFQFFYNHSTANQLHRQTDRQTDRHTQPYRQRDRPIDRQTDREIERHTDRQTDMHSHTDRETDR